MLATYLVNMVRPVAINGGGGVPSSPPHSEKGKILRHLIDIR